MKKLLTATAVIALMASAPVWAEDATPAPANQTDQSVKPDAAKVDAAKPDDSAASTATDDAAKPADSAAATAPADSSMTANFTTAQADGQLLASELIGQTVYNSADENLGDINDILFDQQGATVAVVIGVGGFLGLGEKNVAVPYSALQTGTDSDGNLKLVLNVDKTALENAAPFQSLAEIKAQADADKRAAEQPAVPSDPMAPAPAPAN